MKVKLLTTMFIAMLLLFTACDKDSITEVVLPSNSITLTGDISNSFDAQATAVLSPDGSSIVFSLMMVPKGSVGNSENSLLITKEMAEFPAVGTYNISAYQTDTTAFGSIYGLNDSTLYIMSSGTFEITTSSSTKIEGNFNMTGPLFDLTPTEGNELTVKGKFSTIPIPL
ncbi:MAG: hypothetical protein L3J41_17415 [Melioribacteraceae bacterium]|nr:hypothetical protein [Melioribacteraceae bacterium]